MRAGAPIELGGIRAETLLALLALRAGSPVSTDSLIDEIWAGEPPDGAQITLRSYVSRLRAALGGAASIEHVSAGYVLAVAPEAVDVVRFERAIREGSALLERGRHRRAADALSAALGLWRGDPFSGLRADGALQAEAVRLEELRLHALESRFAAELETGRASELVDELEALVASHPFRERLWRHLMLALYRAGRQADALAAYHRARESLDEQLGIEPSQELQDLEAAILRQEVPSPTASGRTRAGLPAALTSFVGRTREVEEVSALLRRARLVTLFGVGGVGKTRLALEVARRATDDLVEGVAFVDLSATSDPTLLPSLVAGSLGVREAPAQDLRATLAEHLGATELLLVLDNCEHVREAAATLAQELLGASAELRILATSRIVLDVAGEAPYPVAPLGLPSPVDDLDSVRNSDSVRLLVDRATLTRHDLRVDDDAYATAAQICRELDGLPLAIELAAARAKALSLDEIAVRLRDRFQFLVAWRRLTAARHRTLREAMDWSFELLAPDEQRLLTRLSVFPSGATLASVASVCLDGDEAEAERLIERLIDASLVVPTEGERGTRYRILETVRQYGAERLPPADLDGLRRRHAERVRSIAAATNLALEGAPASMSFELAREELASIRAAIQWATEADPALALEIACALERYWVTSLAREGIAVFTALLARNPIPDSLRARAFRCRGGCRYYVGRFEEGVVDYEAALAIHRRLGQHAYAAHLVMRLAIEAQRVGDRPRALALIAEAGQAGDDDRYPADRYVGLQLHADLAFDEGRVDQGLALLRSAVDAAEEAGDVWWQANLLLRLAERAVDIGRLAEAGPAAREALRLSLRTDDRQNLAFGLGTLAREAAGLGRAERAGRIWGGLEAELEHGGPVGQWELEEAAVRAQVAALAGDAFEAAVAAGRSLSLAEVVEEALSPS